MAAGMGDIVFAPLHQALVARGVRIEYFHRVDEVAPERRRHRRRDDHDGSPGCASRRDRAVRPAHPGPRPALLRRPAAARPARRGPGGRERAVGVDLVHVARRGATGPAARRGLRRRGPGRAGGHDPRRRAANWPRHRPRSTGCSTNLRTTATVALQLWLREDEPTLGWGRPGMTVSAFERPLSTWASMPQLIAGRGLAGRDQAGVDRLLLRRHRRPVAAGSAVAGVPRHHLDEAYATAGRIRRAPPAAPAARLARARRVPMGPAVRLGRRSATRCRSQFVRVNVDPSDRYVMCVPGTDQSSAPLRRERVRQPVPRRRLDRQRHQRRLHRGCGAVGPAGGQCHPRPGSLPPHHRDAPAVTAALSRRKSRRWHAAGSSRTGS